MLASPGEMTLSAKHGLWSRRPSSTRCGVSLAVEYEPADGDSHLALPEEELGLAARRRTLRRCAGERGREARAVRRESSRREPCRHRPSRPGRSGRARCFGGPDNGASVDRLHDWRSYPARAAPARYCSPPTGSFHHSACSSPGRTSQSTVRSASTSCAPARCCASTTSRSRRVARASTSLGSHGR